MPPENEKHTEIRLFQDKDADELSTVITRCLKEVNSKDYPAETIGGMVAYFTPEKVKELAQEREMYVAVQADKAIGTVSRDGNKVFTMFINPDFAGQGIGSQLMDYAEQQVATSGFGFVELGASITAHDFYQKRGYDDVRETETESSGLNYIMQKQLNN